MKNWITGIDIGGTHITVCMVDPVSGKLMDQTYVRQSVNPHLSADEIVAGWTAAIQVCWNLANIQSARIGIAMPGPFDYEKGICLIKGLHKYDALYELPVKELLSDELKIPISAIRMVNDATAYIRGEIAMGAVKGATDVLGITLGTGLGSALFRNGIYEEGDLYCFSYKESVAEEYFSTRWFLERYKQKTGTMLTGVKELAKLSKNDVSAVECFSEFGKNLNELIQNRYAPAVPRTIIIGGNIANAADLFFPILQQELGSGYEIKKASLGEHAALIGAAYLYAE